MFIRNGVDKSTYTGEGICILNFCLLAQSVIYNREESCDGIKSIEKKESQS